MGRPKKKKPVGEMTPLEKARAALKAKRQSQTLEQPAPKKRRGRPKGSVSKKAAAKVVVKKKRGRRKKADIVAASGKIRYVVAVSGQLTGFSGKEAAESFVRAKLVEDGVVWKDIQVFTEIAADLNPAL